MQVSISAYHYFNIECQIISSGCKYPEYANHYFNKEGLIVSSGCKYPESAYHYFNIECMISKFWMQVSRSAYHYFNIECQIISSGCKYPDLHIIISMRSDKQLWMQDMIAELVRIIEYLAKLLNLKIGYI